MTETLCTCLLDGVLVVAAANAVRLRRRADRWGRRPDVLLGLTALCRPTVWACTVLLFVAWRPDSRDAATTSLAASPPPAPQQSPPCSLPQPSRSPLGASATGSEFGLPIVTTTHGGYTLLLGNNPAYYDEVVSQPLGVVWDGSHGPGQQAWAGRTGTDKPKPPGCTAKSSATAGCRAQAWRTIRQRTGTVRARLPAGASCTSGASSRAYAPTHPCRRSPCCSIGALLCPSCSHRSLAVSQPIPCGRVNRRPG